LKKKIRIKTQGLSRLMVYMLGHRPFEFGLVPDEEGFVTYRELLRSINEEPGWGHIRQGNINEVLLSEERSLFETEKGLIRTNLRHWNLDTKRPSQSIPKILFTGIRRRAHSVVMDKGLRANEGTYHILSPDKKMAERIGRRRDQEPVLLEVMAAQAHKEGIRFHEFGDLFLALEIPAMYIAGPPIPKEKIIKAGESGPREKKASLPDFQAGTFVLDLKRDIVPDRREKGRKKKGWKEEARRQRRRGR